MSENLELGIDIIDGKVINWDDITDEELQDLQKKLEKEEEMIIKEINRILKI